MHDVVSEIGDVALELAGWEKKISSAARFLRKNNRVYGDIFLEDEMFIKVDGLEDECVTVGGIDGGLLKKEYHGVNVVLTRAVCAVFKYDDGKICGSDYFPCALPSPSVKIFKSYFSDIEFMACASIERLKGELSLACDMLGKDLDFLFLDGSVVLHPSVRVGRGSSGRGNYEALVDIVRKMYSISLDNKVCLAGIVEDSRSQIFLNSCKGMLGADAFKVIENVKDTHILTYCLSVGERTSIFKMIDKSGVDTIFSDVKGFSDNLFSFYIRPAEYDRALRVDFVAGDDAVSVGSRIASAIFFMSRHNSAYGIPPVIIDADQRAKLSYDELLFVESEFKKHGDNFVSFSELRRNSRPF